ncbi:MAG: gliding motility protein GldL [Saprospiraceae bacterium]|nr:gliding motility protein GldL [Saprospiraceae bacterium]
MGLQSVIKTNGFKYLKNLIIGVGASVVLLGALFKLESWEGASEMLIIGLFTEAFIFLFLGLIGPEKDYYWEKLYPGLDNYNSKIAPLTAGEEGADAHPLDGEVVERQLGSMVTELQSMSKSLGALKALQEVDFVGAKDQIKAMGGFYKNMSDAMANLSDSLEDTKAYKEQLSALNKNLGSLNSVYGNVLNAMSNIGK